MNQAVPYLHRCHRTKFGTAVVWPFLNLERSQGPHELFLDTNAFTNAQWLSDVPEDLRRNCIVNPWMAVQEQWFSNPRFREDPHLRINSWVTNLTEFGVKFRPCYAKDQLLLLKKNEAALRRQFSSVIPFVAIMRTLLSPKLPLDDALAKLTELCQADIPRFTGAIALTALGVALKKKQRFKMEGDKKPAYSYLESFLDFQPGRKDETDHMNVPYLRNRAGDLNLWLTLPILRQLGYSIGSNSVLVTEDKALHRFVLRTVPPVMLKHKITSFSIAPNELPQDVYESVCGVVKNLQIREKPSLDEQLARMTMLFNLAKTWSSDQRERDALDEVFSSWWLPGHGIGIKPLSLWACVRARLC